MTRKETLLKEVYAIRNLISEVKGKEQVDIEATCLTWQFKEEAKRWKEHELRSRIEQLGELLTIAKKDKAIKDATEDYYLTPEGAAFKAETEAAMKQTEAMFEETKEQVFSNIKAELQKHLGSEWSVTRLTDNYIEFGVLHPEKENELIFGQTAELYYEKKRYGYDKGAERFELNVGTCGGHDLLPQERTYSFANFYIGIGRFYSNIEFLTWLKNTLFGYADRCKELHKEYNNLEAKLENPLNI